MDSITNTTPPLAGNVGIPDWMLKRRARQQAQAAAPEISKPVQEIESTATFGSESDQAVVSSDAPISNKDEPASVTEDLKQFEISTGPQSSQLTPTIAPRKVALERISLKVEAPQPTDLPWYQDWRQRWFGWKEQKSFLISLFVHVISAAALSVVVFHPDMRNLSISMILSDQGEGGDSEPLDDSVFTIDASGGQTAESVDSMLASKAAATMVGPTTLTVPEDLGGMKMGEGDGTGDQIGDGINVGGYKMPEGGKVVKKGSFAAWTVPEDPKPGEDYKIVIQVKYKQKSQKLNPNDITGSVIGTDKFRLMISPHTSEVIPEANQVVVYIPGAAARVRDTIRVYSAMLKENQRLEIVF